MESAKHKYFPNCDLTIWLRSCREEVTDPVPGAVTYGQIPSWLTGSLVINGPGGINVYGDQVHDDDISEKSQFCSKHLFDGPGLLQKFEFRHGKAFYTNRFVNTKSHKRNLVAQRLVLGEFGTLATNDPCHTIFKRFSAVFQNKMDEVMTDTANISIHPFGDEVYTLAETGFAHRVDLENLKTLETVNVNSEIGIINHSSHPHVFPDKVINIGQKIDAWNGPSYIIAEMETGSSSSSSGESDGEERGSPWSTAEIVATIPSRWLLHLCYMHSFAVTDNYFILIEQPLAVYITEVPVAVVFNTKPVASCLRFFPEEDTLFHVIPRERSTEVKGRRKTFRAPSFFFLHTINAFEENTGGENGICVDICCYNDPAMIDCMYVDALRNAHDNANYANLFRGRPKRFHLSLNDPGDSDGMVKSSEEQLVDFGCETPKINYRYNGKKYRYFYAISSDVDLDHSGWLVKVDTKNRSVEKWGEPYLNTYPSEPIFVEKPGATEEDHGIILSALIYGGEKISGPNTTSVVILDAEKWELLTRIDFNPGVSVPKSLHGWYFPATDDTTSLK